MRNIIRSSGERAGVSLVMVSFAVTVMATMAVAMVMVTSAASKEKRAERQQIAALFAAEAGISEAACLAESAQRSRYLSTAFTVR